MEWIGLVVFIGVIAYIVLHAGRNKIEGTSPAFRSWYPPRSYRKTGTAKPALVLAVAALFIFSVTNACAFDWAFIGGAAGALADQLEQERKMEQQKKLLDYQYKLERERMERTYQLESERQERLRAEEGRIQDERRRQQKIAEEKKLREDAEEKRRAISTGTGFFIAPGGYLVTNHHVIEDATDYAVRDHKGRFYKATVIARDSNRDLALLKVNGAFPALKIASSDSVSKGQHVLAVGYPQISIQGNESKVTDGIISSFSGIRNDDNWFQISVPIQGGNSGGPLVTESGGVVGVVVATANVARFYKMTGNLPQNVNYAIKSKVLLDFLKSQNVQNFSAPMRKISIDAVDASTVLVIAKNGPIDVSYTVSPEQRAQEEREQTRTAAEQARRQREEKLEEQKRVANSQHSEVPRPAVILGIGGGDLLQSKLPPCQEYKHYCYGEETNSSGVKYVGEFKDGKPNGQGTGTKANGEEYVGEFKDGKPNPNGQGTFTSANGEKYVGEFKDGKPNGQGTFTSANGVKYVGEFKDGNSNGQGTFTSANGKKYVGEFKDGKPNGQGTITSANGEKYVGEFKDGKPNGQGVLYRADGSILRAGVW